MEDGFDTAEGFSRARLRELRIQRYEGTKIRPGESDLQQYRRKEFDRRGDIAEQFHETTKLYSETVSPRQRRSVSDFEREQALVYARCGLPPEYRNHEEVPLPDPDRCELSLGRALENRRNVREYAGDPISKRTLSQLLYYGCGEVAFDEITTVKGNYDDEPAPVGIGHRTYPSIGELYPVEPYVVVVNQGGQIRPGVYHYSASEHALRRLGDLDQSVVAGPDSPWLDDRIAYADAAVWILLTGAFGRVSAVHGTRGYRMVMSEAGHIRQNMHLVSTARALGSTPIDSFADDSANELLGVNGVDEGVVSALVVGVPSGDEHDG